MRRIEREAEECTFHPEISRRSKQIMASREEYMSPMFETSRSRDSSRKCYEERNSFRPQTNQIKMDSS